MEPHLVTKEAFTVVGIPFQGQVSSGPFEDGQNNNEIGKAWDQFNTRFGELRHVSGPAIGLCFGMPDSERPWYIAGMEVSQADEVPAGMMAMSVPAQKYAVFECTLPTLGQTYEYIMEQWQPASGFRQEGLVDLVDAMGGITITLDCPLVEKTPDPKLKGQYEYLMLPAGPVFLQGETAKKFVTYRYASTDFSRARRQQQVIWAIRDRALQVDLLPRFGQLWVALSDTFQTDLLIGDVVELAMLGSDLPADRVHGMVLSRKALRSASINGSAILVVADPLALKEEVEGVFASRPIAELGHSATGRCGGVATTATPQGLLP